MNKLWRYYIISSLFCASRMGIGATSVVYMLSAGASLGDIAITKMVQAVVILFAEVPTGLVADYFGRRISLLLAALCSLVSVLVFCSSHSVIGFSIAEIFNGLCLAFWSGAFEAVAVEDTRDAAHGKNFLEFFFARMSTYNALATMFGGLIGGCVGEINISYPFYFSAGLVAFTILVMSFQLPKDRVVRTQNSVVRLTARVRGTLAKIAEQNRNAWRYTFTSPEIRQFFSLQILIQFSIQPLLHYWQPYFTRLSPSAGAQTLGLIFFAYVISQFAFSGLVSRLFEKNYVTPESVNVGTTVIATLSAFFLIGSSSFVVCVTAFVIAQGALGSLRNNLGAGFNRFVSDGERATVLSTVSLVSRFGMLANLIILNLTAEKMAITNVFLTSAVGMILVSLTVVRWNRMLAPQQVVA